MSELTIPPALTSFVWRTKRFGYPQSGLLVSLVGDTLHVCGCTSEDDCAGFRGADRHALAALALHGQPFGFTRNMAPSDERFALLAVLLTRARLAGVCTEEEYNAARDTVLDLKDATARITALLPPEDET